MVGFANKNHIVTLSNTNGVLLTVAKSLDGRVFIEKVFRGDDAIREYHKLKGLIFNGR